MLVSIDIIMLEQFILDFSNKTAFIGRFFYLIDLDIEIPYVSI